MSRDQNAAKQAISSSGTIHDDSSNASVDERTSLLHKPHVVQEDVSALESGKSSPKRAIHAYLAEIWLLLKVSVPVILAYALQNSLQTVSVLVVGRLSPEALATAAFAYMFAMCTAWLIGIGGTTAMDTLGSVVFTGSKSPHDLGIILQRSYIILALFYIPVVILWFVSEPLFNALGQEAYLARDASHFLMVLSPGGLGYIYFECMKKFLQAQGKSLQNMTRNFHCEILHMSLLPGQLMLKIGMMRPGTYVLFITSPLNLLLNYLFIYPFDLGLLGAPLATGISYWLSFLLLLAYARFTGAFKETWPGWSRACLRNSGQFARLAILGVIHVGTEWWAFEIVALVAGRLGTISLAAQSVIMTTDMVLNTIPFGVGVATSARVGNLLGAKDALSAGRAANAAAWLSMLLGVVVLTILMGVKDVYARIFNNDNDVVALTAKVMPFVALFQIADGLNGSMGGALRGQGRQHVGAAVNIVSYYCGALPLGIWLAFHGWGLTGLWIGQCIALYLVGAIEWAIVGFSNWDKEVERAFARMDSNPDETDEALDEHSRS